MDANLTKNAQGIQDALNAKGLKCRVIEMPATTRTADDAANAIGCEVDQIAKSLIFKTKESGKPVLILTSGSNRVNEKTVARHLGEAIVKADADFVREVTGFAIGSIPPIGHKNRIELVLIDVHLMHYEEVWAAAGTSNSVFMLGSKDLISMTGGRIVSIA